MEFNVNLACFVEFGRLVDSINRVPLIDVRDKLKDHGCCLNISFLFVREDNLAGNLLRDSAVEFDWEVQLSSWFNLNRVGLNREIWAAIKLYPIADWVLGWVAELNVLGDHIAEYCWELYLGFGNVMRQSLV